MHWYLTSDQLNDSLTVAGTGLHHSEVVVLLCCCFAVSQVFTNTCSKTAC